MSIDEDYLYDSVREYLNKKVRCIKVYSDSLNDYFTINKFYKIVFISKDKMIYVLDNTKEIVCYNINTFYECFELKTLAEVRDEKIKNILE